MRGDFLNYTEKEKKGIDKVERMNLLFDKVIMPAIGILVIMLLLSFTISKFREKFVSHPSQTSSSTSGQPVQPAVFAQRKRLLSGYDGFKEAFAAYGYHPVKGYSYDLSLCKTVDSEMSLFQFSDGTLGDLTVINYFPTDKESSYSSLSMAVSSDRLINVTVKSGDESFSVVFTSTDFSAYKSDDGAQFDAMMNVVSMDDIRAMYEIFETDIDNLAKNCSVSE